MSVHYADGAVILHHGDCLDVMAEMADASVDAVVTDPPYGLEFMGREWDRLAPVDRARMDGARRDHGSARIGGFERAGVRYSIDGLAAQAWHQKWATECLRVLKPGGHLLAFGGSRTWHRLASAIEDAGFEMRDSIAWLYGSGFPKSLDVSKAIDKAAGAEREVVSEGKAVKRMIPGADQGATGSWIKDNGRTFTPTVTRAGTPEAAEWNGWGTALKPAFEPIVVARKPLNGTVAANVLKHGTGALNVDACRVEAHDSQLAEKYASVQNAPPRNNSIYGEDKRSREGATPNDAGRWPPNVALDTSQAAELDRQTGVTTSRIGQPRGAASGDGWGMTATGAEYDDQGGASRFFPTFHYAAKASTSERPREDDTSHPTVKPVDLMRWLVRLVTPGGGLVLDPFAGSGTTAEACVVEGMRCVLIEKSEEYLPLIVQRLTKPIQVALDATDETIIRPAEDPRAALALATRLRQGTLSFHPEEIEEDAS